jgi:hypothetical protein
MLPKPQRDGFPMPCAGACARCRTVVRVIAAGRKALKKTFKINILYTILREASFRAACVRRAETQINQRPPKYAAPRVRLPIPAAPVPGYQQVSGKG